MRLLNVKTRKSEEFFDNIPPYAILSHRWGDDEVTFQDIKSGRLSGLWKSRSWPLKLEGCFLQAKKDNDIICPIYGSTHVASTRQTPWSSVKQSTLCSTGTSTLRGAMCTFRM